MDSCKHAKNIVKMKTFYATKCKAYSHERLYTLKGVINSKVGWLGFMAYQPLQVI